MTPKFIVQTGIIAFLVAFSGQSLAHIEAHYHTWRNASQMMSSDATAPFARNSPPSS